MDEERAPLTNTSSDRYVPPGWVTRRITNPSIRWLVRRGVSLAGSRELRVVGRRRGQVRTVVVNVLEVDGARYLVAPRGTTAWVRDLRAAGGAGELRIGRRIEGFTACELPDEVKVPLLRAYLRRWGWEVGRFFEGVDEDADDDELRAIAPGFPVFRLER